MDAESVDDLLLVSLFDGIGGARRALELACIQPVGYVSVECDETAKRVVEYTWPDREHSDDVKSFGEMELRRIELKHGRTGTVLVVAGSPCQGFSRVIKIRKGLEDERSSLVWEVFRVANLIREVWSSSSKMSPPCQATSEMRSHGPLAANP